MKAFLPLVFGLSLALNVALVVLLVRGANPAGARSSSFPVVSPAPATASATPALSPAVAAVASESRKMDRAMSAALETGDLPALVVHLRAAGFPADVIRAIVGAELGELFIARRKELDPAEETRPFWQSRRADPKLNAEISRVSREHEKIMRDLLGDEDAQHPMSLAYQNRRLAGLPPDKVAGVRRILRDYDEMKADVYMLGMPTPADQEKLAAIDKAQQEDMAQLLSPTELFEYSVRSGPTAQQLRNQLAAFHPTEAEFRAIYPLQAAFNDQFGNRYGPLSAEQQQQRNEARKLMTEQVKAALGPERGDDYIRASEFNYRLTSQLVARLQLPAETANQVWSVQQDIQQRSRSLNADSSLSPDQRTQRLAVMADEARSRISAALGAHGFEAYRQYGGQWMRELQPNAAAGANGTSPAPVILYGP